MARHIGVEGWEFLPVEESLEAAVLWPMQYYARHYQATIEEYNYKIPIHELWNGAD